MCTINYSSVEALTAALKKAWDDLSPEVVRRTCASAVNRFSQVVKKRGGYIENLKSEN